MPVIPGGRDVHRVKAVRGRSLPFPACVARPVGKEERSRVKAARDSIDKEWQRLRDKHVWDDNDPVEWDTVRRQAEKDGTEVHLGDF